MRETIQDGRSTYWHCSKNAVRAAELSYQDVGICHVAAYNTTIKTHNAERKQVLEIETGESTSKPANEGAEKPGSAERTSHMRSLYIVYEMGCKLIFCGIIEVVKRPHALSLGGEDFVNICLSWDAAPSTPKL